MSLFPTYRDYLAHLDQHPANNPKPPIGGPMNTAEIEAQQFNVNVGQGKIILALLKEIESIIEDAEEGIDPVTATIILDLARSITNIGGKSA